MVSTRRYRKIITVHAHVEGGIGRDGVRVGIIRDVSVRRFLVLHDAVKPNVGKIVCPDPFQE